MAKKIPLFVYHMGGLPVEVAWQRIACVANDPIIQPKTLNPKHAGLQPMQGINGFFAYCYSLKGNHVVGLHHRQAPLDRWRKGKISDNSLFPTSLLNDMKATTPFLFSVILFLASTALAQSQSSPMQSRGWRDVNLLQEQKIPARSVATGVPSDFPEPAYVSSSRRNSAVARTNAPLQLQASFWGESIPFRSESVPAIRLGGSLSQQRIADAYAQLQAVTPSILMSEVQQQASLRKLNDWGYLQWVHTVTGSMFPADPSARVLATAWLMQKSGYRATVSFSGSKMYLLVQTRQTLYGHAFLNTRSGRMYVVDPLGTAPSLQSASLFEPTSGGRPIDMTMKEAPRLGGESSYRLVTFRYQGQTYRGQIAVNQRVAKFYYRYPMVDWSVYVGAPMSREALNTLDEMLLPILDGLQPRRGWTADMEKANCLLHFVQSGFPYRTDQESLGREHYAFAEEMLALPYSDCEDRSAFYLTLVRRYLKLEAVGLLFPGHAAVGVPFPANVPGDAVTLGSTRYLVCDPSYLGADIGRALPQVQGQRLKVYGTN